MRAIVNLSTQKYWPGQKRLADSIKDIPVLLFKNEKEVGANPHNKNNYSFKPLAMQKAFYAGYRYVLWLDASMFIIRDLSPIFEIIEKDGYFFQDSGWLTKDWCNKQTSDYFGTNDGEMLSSGVLGIDIGSEIGKRFFDRWMAAMQAGMFNGSWDNHRHDQTCASIIAHQLGMKLQTGNSFFIYGQAGQEVADQNVLIIAHGIC